MKDMKSTLYSIPYRNWTIEEETRLKELVATNQYSYRQIGAMMNRSINSITCHARQYLDIRNDQFDYARKYQHNETFFDVPTILNSYVAGFWAADGGMMKTSTGYRLRVELSIIDEQHLNMLKNALGHTGPIKYWKAKNTSFFNIYVSESYGNVMAANFGLIPNKSHRLTPPNLPSFETKFSYLLGLLDGDGCVHISNTGLLSLSYASSSRVAVRWVQEALMTMNLPQLKKRHDFKIKDLRPRAEAWSFAMGGARTVCLIQLAQEFARRHNLPVLARKWNNQRLNRYISDYYTRFPRLIFNPISVLDQLIASSP